MPWCWKHSKFWSMENFFLKRVENLRALNFQSWSFLTSAVMANHRWQQVEEWMSFDERAPKTSVKTKFEKCFWQAAQKFQRSTSNHLFYTTCFTLFFFFTAILKQQLSPRVRSGWGFRLKMLFFIVLIFLFPMCKLFRDGNHYTLDLFSPLIQTHTQRLSPNIRRCFALLRAPFFFSCTKSFACVV